MTTSTSNASTPSTKSPRSFYDAHTTFEGYINRATLVTPKSKTAKPYWSVSICMLSGSQKEPTRTTVDTIVRGGEAERLIAEHAHAVGKVVIYGQFKVSDMGAKSYTNKDGQLVHTLTGRLILIPYLEVNKDIVHSSPKLKSYTPRTAYKVQTTFSGFVNSAIVRTSKKGTPYWSVSLCMLSGSTDAPTKIIVNTVCCGNEVAELIEKHTGGLGDKKNKVAIFGSFKLDNISPSSFINKENETVYTLQGILSAINYLKVGKDVVVQAPQHGYTPDAAQHADQPDSAKSQEAESHAMSNNSAADSSDLDQVSEEADDSNDANSVGMMSFGSLEKPLFPVHA